MKKITLSKIKNEIRKTNADKKAAKKATKIETVKKKFIVKQLGGEEYYEKKNYFNCNVWIFEYFV